MALRTAISSPGGDFKVSYFLFRSWFLMLPERSEDLHELIPFCNGPRLVMPDPSPLETIMNGMMSCGDVL